MQLLLTLLFEWGFWGLPVCIIPASIVIQLGDNIQVFSGKYSPLALPG